MEIPKFYRGKRIERPQLRLVRGVDGRLRSAGEGDIGDVWAEQKRIQLAEAIEEDKRRAEKKQRRKERWGRLLNRAKGHGVPKTTAEPTGGQTNPRELVFNINLPKFRSPKLSRVKLPKIRHKPLAIGALAALVLVVGVIGYGMLSRPNSDGTGGKGVLHESLPKETPNFAPVLPSGKSIDDLGGWARVSPPDKDPVFAYVDTTGSARLNVSQQPLPQDFEQDPATQLAKVAEQFNAKEKIAVDQTEVYIGTSAKGPQSAILIKNELLILIRSSSALTDDQWAAYVLSLN